ncbi:hypothetical protein EYF80_015693 [Liparis tanakae]|uniref:Uncharacterized protein n=1 Tax=Liparis tanakae TaxID=230148 RepID=A0A4Z2I9H5_9TELE|nr:hypothetical protein EYF80_015693 [Liparis tanakae]
MGSFCSALNSRMAVVTVMPRDESPVQTMTGDSLQPSEAVSRLQHPIRTRCTIRRRVLGATNHCAVKNPTTW